MGHDSGFGTDFLEIVLKAHPAKKKKFVKIKNLGLTGYYEESEKTPPEWKVIVADCIFVEWLVSRINEELLQLNTSQLSQFLRQHSV